MRKRQALLFAAITWGLIGVSSVVQAHQKDPGRDSVDTSPSTNRTLRYVSETRYSEALTHAKQSWNALNTATNVTMRPAQSGEDYWLKVVDIPNREHGDCAKN